MKNKSYLIILCLFLFVFKEASAQSSSWKSTLDKKQSEVIVHYYNSEHFISDASGKLQGIEYDLLEAFFTYCERTYDIQLKRTYKKADSFGRLYHHMKENATSGEFGACSFSMTPQRMEEVQFSPKYISDIEVLICSHNIPLASDTNEFIEAFKNATALTVQNTTYDEDIQNVVKLIPDLKVLEASYASNIRDRIAKENDLFSYIELPNYILALKEGINIKRQYMFKVERWGYGFIYPLSSDWKAPVAQYFSTDVFKNDVKRILIQHLGNDVRELINDQGSDDEKVNTKELALLNKEREIQDLEIEKQRMKLENEQFWRYIIIGATLFVIIVAFLLFKQNRLKQRTNELLVKQFDEIKLQKQIIEEKNQDITNSITYAERIQSAALSSDKQVHDLFPHSFILYAPKHTLSGDFYWVGEVVSSTLNNIAIAAVGDCTGHGVPGALLSILGINYLNIASTNPTINSPSEALDFVNKGIMNTFGNEGDSISDGMDASMVAISKDTLMMSYACAINAVYVARAGEITVLKGDRFPIGKKTYDTFQGFTLHTFQLQKNDMIYLFSDGFADQFSDDTDKKYGIKKFKDMLASIHQKDVLEQKEIISKELDDWKGSAEQTDDICIFGIKV